MAPLQVVQAWRALLGLEAEVCYVRELRIAYDAVMVMCRNGSRGRPAAHGAIADGIRPPPADISASSVRKRADFDGEPALRSGRSVRYDDRPAPAGLRDRFVELEAMAEVLYVGAPDAVALDLREAMKDLRARGISACFARAVQSSLQV